MMTCWVRPWIWSFFLSIYCASVLANPPIELKYVSPEMKSELESQFNQATALFDSTISQQWTCELFGVRTGLQHEKDLQLYAFNSAAKLDFTNSGIGPVRNYSMNLKKNELLGNSEKVQEQVRRTNKNQIISKISQLKSHQVLAYAKCSPAKAS